MTRVSLVLVTLALAVAAFAQQALTSTVTSVALFKQGYGVIVREVTLPAGQTESIINDVPVPVHGTFWIQTAPAVGLTSVLATEGDKPRTVPVVSLAELLRANVGEKVELKTMDGYEADGGWVAGKLLSVAENREAAGTRYASQPDIFGRTYPSSNYSSYNPLAAGAADLVILQQDTGPLALPLSSIRQIRKAAADGPLKTTLALKETGAVLKLRSNGTGGKAIISYLTRGLTWAPSYRLDVAGVKGRLTAKATLLNDVEDLTVPTLSCMAGFPNLAFSGVVDPLAGQSSVESFLSSLASPGGSTRGSMITQQAVMMNSYSPYNEMPTLPATAAGEEDLFSYPLKNITLANGERAAYTLFEQDVDYKDIYRWEAADINNTTDPYRYRSTDTPQQAQDVWHALRLTNTGTQPWTTAPILLCKGDTFLGESTMYYTSVGGESTVDINKALDVHAENEETTLQKIGDIIINHSTYSTYAISGTLTVKNYKKEIVHMVVTKHMTGTPTESSIKPTQNDEQLRLNAVNATRTLVWEFDVAPGGSMEVTCKYKINVS
jgi:hypothetical protein